MSTFPAPPCISHNYKDEGGSNVWDEMCSNITTQFMWVARVGTLTYNNGTTCIDCYDPNDPLKPYDNCTSAEMKFYYTPCYISD